MREREPITRKELIRQCIAWKMRNPFYVKLIISRREVISPKELGIKLNPDSYNLPRVFESKDSQKD